MTAYPSPPPEARLIREKREALVPHLSMRAAAQRAAADGLGPFSVALWTQIENGYIQQKETTEPTRGTADRIARMARVTGATTAELEHARRPDAARVLAKLLPARTAPGRGSLRERIAHLERVATEQAELARELREQMDEEDEEDDRARRHA